MANTRLQERYQKEIVPALIEEFGYTNVMQVPRVTKLTLNMGVGEASQDAKALEEASKQLGQITGQKPQVRRARKSIANFKLRAGMPVGLRVTLRGDRMWEMLDRLLSIALPRLPRHPGQWFRWAGQLQSGSAGADHLSGDRLRQDRSGPRTGHRHHHQRGN
jgi:ribosomal protein L5